MCFREDEHRITSYCNDKKNHQLHHHATIIQLIISKWDYHGNIPSGKRLHNHGTSPSIHGFMIYQSGMLRSRQQATLESQAVSISHLFGFCILHEFDDLMMIWWWWFVDDLLMICLMALADSWVRCYTVRLAIRSDSLCRPGPVSVRLSAAARWTIPGQPYHSSHMPSWNQKRYVGMFKYLHIRYITIYILCI